MCEIYTIMAPCKMAVNSFLYKPVTAPGAPWSHSTPHPRGQTDAPPSASVGPQWAPGSDRWMRQPTKPKHLQRNNMLILMFILLVNINIINIIIIIINR